MGNSTPLWAVRPFGKAAWLHDGASVFDTSARCSSRGTPQRRHAASLGAPAKNTQSPDLRQK